MIEVFYSDRKAVKVPLEKLRTLARLKKRIWVDLTNPTPNEVTLVKEIFGIHPITAEDILTPNTRAKIEEFDRYIFVVLYGMIKQRNIRLMEMDFILGKNFLVTSHKGIASFNKLKSEGKKMSSLFKGGMDFLMHSLIDMEVDNFIPAMEAYDNAIDRIEARIIRDPGPDILAKILDLKRRINKIKKIIIPQQEKISFLAKNKYSLISPSCQTYFRDVHDHFYTVTDMIEDYRDTLSGSFDAYMSSVSNTTNEVMKVLSVMATIMLPLTVISGVYGMNFLVLPGAKDPLGFWYIIVIMLALIAVMLGFFKKKGWM
ncbi:MAG: magnesium/cobalt transporter CorA [Candidatus Aenigmarchaeota archaeon]|nr:magnesium/cobalt transporter CorA [Candidatus Aenigmarchaeota archaeon]